MTIQITRAGKHPLIVASPVMPAAGTFGFGNVYHHLINIAQLGAIVTNPVTYEPFSPTTSTRVIPLDAGVLIHTGLPNPGLRSTLKQYRSLWMNLPCPVILHLVAQDVETLIKAVKLCDQEDSLAAIELGLPDDSGAHEAQSLTLAATKHSEKPVIVRLPASDALEIAHVVAEAGAGALVVAAPPRGIARDPQQGRMVSGRIYGPLVKPMVLNLVKYLAERLKNIPIIGAGGIHSPQDARDYLDMGAVAIQVDAVTWGQPKLLERIARDLGGTLVTRMSDAFPDEWHPDMGDTEYRGGRK